MQKINEQFKSDLNGKWREVINKAVKRELGVEVNMVSDDYGKLTDTIKTDVNDKMRGNKILRSLFADAYLHGYAYEFKEENSIAVWLHVGYNHVGGGSNGHQLKIIYINTETGKVTTN